tara:strand:+ start:25 stop:927 length:903 start_codon:yes stop_codon:yes gene_type:complete
MDAILFDIDGTLANVEHRLHHLHGVRKDWDSFFAAQTDDPVIEPIAWLAKRCFDIYREHALIIVTARPEQYRAQTQKWLEKHLIQHHMMFMRQDGDFRPDYLVKRDILENILSSGFEPFLVIDDRPEVVDMWRSYGIKTLQCVETYSKSEYDGQVKLKMMIGPSGAGKTSFVKNNYPSASVISTDQIREEHGWGHHPYDVKKTFDYAYGLIRLRLSQGLEAVYDATNIRKKHRMEVLSLVPKGQLVEYVVIDRDYEEKVRDRDWRTEDLIKRHHNQMKKEIKDVLNGDEQPNVIVIDKRS